jgi:hypothetical protein
MQQLVSFKISSERIKGAQIHPSKNLICFGSEKGQISLWNF